MQWIAPSEKDADSAALEKRLWEAADQFRANSGPTPIQYSTLGLIRPAARRREISVLEGDR